MDNDHHQSQSSQLIKPNQLGEQSISNYVSYTILNETVDLFISIEYLNNRNTV